MSSPVCKRVTLPLFSRETAPPNLAPTIPKLVSATLNSIDLSWEYATAAHGADAPTILGYHIQYRGDGRASVAADSWKRASSFQVLAFEQVVREKEKPPMSVSVFGLSSDTAYCFRVRARGAGGWGPFSIVSSGYRTLSFSSTLDQFSTVQRAISTGGVQGVMVLMKKHSEIRAVQLHCVRELARMAIRSTRFASLCCLPGTALLMDLLLQQGSCFDRKKLNSCRR